MILIDYQKRSFESILVIFELTLNSREKEDIENLQGNPLKRNGPVASSEGQSG